MTSEPLQIISLGAGVQSSAMALMAAAGEITPMPQHAVFADTQAEPDSVYRWLDWLEKQLPFPVHRVTAGSLEKDTLTIRKRRDGKGYWNPSGIPYYSINKDGSRGHGPRQCTHDFKLIPLFRKQRELAGIKRKRIKDVRVVTWIGISRDESHRMKDSRNAWCQHRWPLIELGLTREHCLKWMKEKGHPKPPRSACVFCPYHSNKEWLRLKTEEPESFQRAVAFDYAFRATKKQTVMHTTMEVFLHNSCVALDQIDFNPKDDGQQDMFGNECEGMCGV